MNEKAEIIHELMNKVTELEKFFKEHNPVDVFSEEIRPCKNSDGKILNVNIGFSFQSRKDDEKLELCIRDFSIGHCITYIMHTGSKEWKEEHYVTAD